MEVIILTTLFSVVFAIFFLLLFLRMRQDGDSCSDQDALIPFQENFPTQSSESFPEENGTDR